MTRLVLALLSFVALTGVAHAADDRVIKLSEEKIVGKIQKPEIEILITKQNLNPPYDLVLKESFVPRVLAVVDEKPF